MADFPIMPLYTDALIGDAGDLPNALFGAYVRLLVRWWREGALPEPNEKRLARWAGLSSSDFEDLKEFLFESEKGWGQKKLFTTYAQQLAKSIKARNSANARKGGAVDERTLKELIAEGYANRVLSMNHEPISNSEEANASSLKEKNKKQKRKEECVDRSEEQNSIAIPDDPDLQKICASLVSVISEAKFKSYLQNGDQCAISKNGTGYVIRATSGVRGEFISNRIGGALDRVIGKGEWRIEVGK